ncbi:MAG: DUF5694 domain-containing protein [Rudaea sp.]|nr:DUF5694 domain-containing protein [Rudaea sp.]
MRANVLFAIVIAFSASAARTAGATEVMILGTYHMANPGLDLHNVKSDDVLLPKRQRELEAIAGSLATFKPTLVAVESPAKSGAAAKVEKYHEYTEGKLADSRNEVVQVGFRLARQMNLPEVWGIDVQSDFPYDAVKRFAESHGPALQDRLDALDASVERMLDGLNRVLKAGSIGDGLRYMNDPQRIAEGNEFYRSMLLFGAGIEQPGAALLDAWQARNNAICARLIQLARPADRVVVVYGAGHSYLLRQCVREMPGFKLVEANDYLPQ